MGSLLHSECVTSITILIKIRTVELQLKAEFGGNIMYITIIIEQLRCLSTENVPKTQNALHTHISFFKNLLIRTYVVDIMKFWLQQKYISSFLDFGDYALQLW